MVTCELCLMYGVVSQTPYLTYAVKDGTYGTTVYCGGRFVALLQARRFGFRGDELPVDEDYVRICHPEIEYFYVSRQAADFMCGKGS